MNVQTELLNHGWAPSRRPDKQAIARGLYNSRKRPAHSVKLIVRRGATRRFTALKQKVAGLPVAVSWDRRKSERRATVSPAQSDQRKSDRRQKPAFTWELADFVVVSKRHRRE